MNPAVTNPTFSVIVPTFNRPGRLRECIEALAAMDYPADEFEIVVVDDGSDSPLDDVVASFRDHTHVRLLHQENAGPASARNHGAREAKGRFLAFTDDDCCPSRTWLQAFEQRLTRDPDVMAGGSTVNRLKDNIFSEASETLLQALCVFSNQDPENGRFFASNNIAMGRDPFMELDGFDETFPLAAAEDRDFCNRWTHAGRRLVTVPDALVHHGHAHTLRSFLRQHANYGRGAVQYQRLRAERSSGVLTDDMGFHLHFFRWLREPLRRSRAGRRPLLLGWVLMTQAAYAWGFASEKLRKPGPQN
jgi:glycosyltransferase involved in cell wall biosynthesis